MKIKLTGGPFDGLRRTEATDVEQLFMPSPENGKCRFLDRGNVVDIETTEDHYRYSRGLRIGGGWWEFVFSGTWSAK